MEEKIKCLRCGQCCHYFDFETEKWVPCQWLRFDGDITRCLIYKNRIGKPMNRHGEPIPCGYRKDSYNFKDCPFNVLNPKKPIVEVY